ncbi:hypothetical protein MRS44_003942 [Fusarium solani]|uniref:uncharacterized protein n=1 Tax=Fusarium solani TaxID=169388 RepID=UPI0032C3FC40|nr:hypothetical protein MRS44_003942 [Fusarium solani]
MLPQNPYLIVGVLAALYAFHLLRNYLSPGLRSIPGPFAAKLSNLWRMFVVRRGQSHLSLIALHRRYGDNVRIGPRVVSISNMNDVIKVYNVKRGFAKQLNNGKATETLFTTLNEGFHARIKRPVANSYSMTTLTEYEPLVDRTILVLFDELDRRYATSANACPLFEWLQYYAFDVIGELTCSKSFGFLRSGSDVDGIIEQLNQAMDYNAAVGQMPWLDHWMKKNPILSRFSGSTGAVAKFAIDRLRERFSTQPEIGDASDGKGKKTLDFVDRFVRAKETHPETVNDGQVLSYMITNMFAGSDTTAISLRAIMYYTLKYRQVHLKLLAELDGAYAADELSVPATWRQSQQLPYFNAVVQEALRLHPAVGLILERLVPPEGLKLTDGTELPHGTIVGASPWVMHRQQSVFGQDVDAFRPDRWLQSDDETAEAFEKRLKAMNGATFTFGKGHRTCIGKNISLLEIYKMLPSFFLTYDVSLVDPDADWKIKNSWFVRQESVEVIIRRRQLPYKGLLK